MLLAPQDILQILISSLSLLLQFIPNTLPQQASAPRNFTNWMVVIMGCGIARFGRKGLKTTETWKFWSQNLSPGVLRRGAPGVSRHSAMGFRGAAQGFRGAAPRGFEGQRQGVSRGSATDKRLQWFIISRCPSRSHLITRDLEAQRKMINHWSLLLVALPWRSRNHTWLSLRSNKNTCWAATYLLSSAIIYSVVWLMQVISCVASQSSYKLKICLLVFELSAFCCISILCLQDYSV